MKTTKESSKGTMFFNADLLPAYKQAKKYAGKDGKVATALDVVDAKLAADAWDPVWTNYISTTSGEFFGKSKQGNKIVVVGHGIEDILNDAEIMERSMKDLRENSKIQLTREQFLDFADGKYCPVQVLDHKNIVEMREFPTSTLSLSEAIFDDLLLARLGPRAAEYLEMHEKITAKESEKDKVTQEYCILTNEHEYPYAHQCPENCGQLITLGQLVNSHHWHEHPQRTHASIMSEVGLSDLTHAARFIAMTEKGFLSKIRKGIDGIYKNLSKNWRQLSNPVEPEKEPGFYKLMLVDGEYFAMYEKEGARMDTGISKFHVRSVEEIPGPESFTTTIGGYHGLVKYDIEEVKSIAPKDANAYTIENMECIWEGGNPKFHEIYVKFYRADIDTSRMILKEDEVKEDPALVKLLLSE